MKFLLDARLPRRLCRRLRENGFCRFAHRSGRAAQVAAGIHGEYPQQATGGALRITGFEDILGRLVPLVEYGTFIPEYDFDRFISIVLHEVGHPIVMLRDFGELKVLTGADWLLHELEVTRWVFDRPYMKHLGPGAMSAAIDSQIHYREMLYHSIRRLRFRH